MNTVLLQCLKCRAPLLEGVFNLRNPVPCPNCRTPVQVEVFPAFFRPASAGQEGEAVLIAGESSCFYHPQKKAVRPCAGCGRFLCALCDCDLNGQHFCPACLDAGRTKGKIKNLENQRTRYDNIALALAIYPMLIFYLTFITAPVVLFMVIRYWNAPRSIVHQTKTRFVLAALFAGLQILGWIIGIYYIINRNSHG